jgi:hypothetical protein
LACHGRRLVGEKFRVTDCGGDSNEESITRPNMWLGYFLSWKKKGW